MAAALALFAGPAHVRAEIYTWVDAQGRLNVGNLPPPDGARVTRVAREAPPNPYNAAAHEAARKAEVDALAQQVDRLQNELQLAARQPAPPPQFVVVPVAAPIPYFVETPAPAQSTDCGAGWYCYGGWNGGVAPFVSYVYAPSPRYRNPLAGSGQGHGAHGGRGGDRGRDRDHSRRPMPKPLASIRP
ncbi:MAG: DUF4124 domain-containing protein [Casimicrobiaceae bacterium]